MFGLNQVGAPLYPWLLLLLMQVFYPALAVYTAGILTAYLGNVSLVFNCHFTRLLWPTTNSQRS